MTHEIKILEQFADAVLTGDKPFEVRYNDRGYQKGDTVKFQVIQSSTFPEATKITHPLNDKNYKITYVLSGYGLQENYVVFGIMEVE